MARSLSRFIVARRRAVCLLAPLYLVACGTEPDPGSDTAIPPDAGAPDAAPPGPVEPGEVTGCQPPAAHVVHLDEDTLEQDVEFIGQPAAAAFGSGGTAIAWTEYRWSGSPLIKMALSDGRDAFGPATTVLETDPWQVLLAPTSTGYLLLAWVTDDEEETTDDVPPGLIVAVPILVDGDQVSAGEMQTIARRARYLKAAAGDGGVSILYEDASDPAQPRLVHRQTADVNQPLGEPTIVVDDLGPPATYEGFALVRGGPEAGDWVLAPRASDHSLTRLLVREGAPVESLDLATTAAPYLFSVAGVPGDGVVVLDESAAPLVHRWSWDGVKQWSAVVGDSERPHDGNVVTWGNRLGWVDMAINWDEESSYDLSWRWLDPTGASEPVTFGTGSVDPERIGGFASLGLAGAVAGADDMQAFVLKSFQAEYDPTWDSFDLERFAACIEH